MTKRDQTVRVVLVRDDDKRALLVTWRNGLDYYSAVAGSTGHRSHHKSGRVHSNLGKWGSKFYYTDKQSKSQPLELDGSQLLQVLIVQNDKCLHTGDLPLKEYTGKQADLLVEITEEDVDDESVVIVITGFTTNTLLAEQEWSDLERFSTLRLVKFTALPSVEGPSIFVVVIQGLTMCSKAEVGADLKKLLQLPSIAIPGPGSYACIRRRIRSYNASYTEVWPTSNAR